MGPPNSRSFRIAKLTTIRTPSEAIAAPMVPILASVQAVLLPLLDWNRPTRGVNSIRDIGGLHKAGGVR